MMLVLATAIIGAVGGLAKTVMGGVQAAKANKLRKNLKDPGAEVTEATKQSTALARNLAATTYVDPRDTDASRGRTSDILSEATRRGSGIDNVADAYRMEQQDQGRRYSQAAGEFYSNNARYAGALGALAQEQLRVQQYGQGRFQEELKAVGQLATAGQNNIVGGLDSIAAVAASAMGREAENKTEGGSDGGTGGTGGGDEYIKKVQKQIEDLKTFKTIMPATSTTVGNATTTEGVAPVVGNPYQASINSLLSGPSNAHTYSGLPPAGAPYTAPPYAPPATANPYAAFLTTLFNKPSAHSYTQ